MAERGPVRPVRLITLMCLAEVASMLGFSTFPALLPTFQAAWDLSATEAGWLNAIFFAGYMVSVPVLVSLTDRVDPKRVYLLSMGISAVALGAFALLAQGFWSALVLRLLAGIGLAGTYMPGLKALSDLVEGKAQTRAVSFYTSAFGIGTSLSFYVAGRIEHFLDWQWAFGVAAAGPALALPFVVLVLPGRTPERGAAGHPLAGFREVLGNRRAMGYTLAYAAHNFELFAMRSWLVAYLVYNAAAQPGGTVPIAPATVAAFVTLLALPSSVSGNELAVRFGRRRVVAAIMLASAAVAVTLGFSGTLPWAAVLGLALLYGVTCTADSSSITAGTVGEASPHLRGTTMAVHSAVGFLGSFLGPLVFGVVLDLAGGGATTLSWGVAFAVSGLAVAMGPVALWILSPPQPAPAQAASDEPAAEADGG